MFVAIKVKCSCEAVDVDNKYVTKLTNDMVRMMDQVKETLTMK